MLTEQVIWHDMMLRSSEIREEVVQACTRHPECPKYPDSFE